MSRAEFVVVGGGLTGLAVAWHLARSGARDVLVLEGEQPGHTGGSSHGRSRMIRSTYGSALYVRLVAEALAHDWPELGDRGGEALITPCPALFFGPHGGLFDGFREATLAQGLPGVSDLPLGAAQERFPALRVVPGDGAVLDETAGVISADRTLVALRAAALDDGVSIRTHAPVQRIERGAELACHLDGGERVHADRLVVCAGAWTPQLLPELAAVITPLRQVVGYAAPGAVEAPCWARLDGQGLTYGLPDHGGDGAKMAAHRLTGPPDDPDHIAPLSEEDHAAHLAAMEPVWREVPAQARLETCLYAATASEDPVLTRLPSDARITVLAGLSGHGFKLGPLLGRIAAQVALGRPSGVRPFEEKRARFGVSR